MEKDKQRNQKTRRRERAQRMQAEKRQTLQNSYCKSGGGGGDSNGKDCDSAEDELPLKEKPKRPPPPNRRKKSNNGSTTTTANGGQNNNNIGNRNGNVISNGSSKENVYEEDIIDGFAIFSFSTYDDLENSLRNIRCGQITLGVDGSRLSAKSAEQISILNNHSTRTSSPQSSPLRNSAPSPTADSPTKNLTITNVRHENSAETTPTTATTNDSRIALPLITPVVSITSSELSADSNCNNRNSVDAVRDKSPMQQAASPLRDQRASSHERLSDISSRCSSGKGYMCDSEGDEADDDKGSDADLFPSPPSSCKRELPRNGLPNHLASSVLNGSSGDNANDRRSPSRVRSSSSPPPPPPLSSSSIMTTTTTTKPQIRVVTPPRYSPKPHQSLQQPQSAATVLPLSTPALPYSTQLKSLSCSTNAASHLATAGDHHVALPPGAIPSHHYPPSSTQSSFPPSQHSLPLTHPQYSPTTQIYPSMLNGGVGVVPPQAHSGSHATHPVYQAHAPHHMIPGGASPLIPPPAVPTSSLPPCPSPSQAAASIPPYVASSAANPSSLSNFATPPQLCPLQLSVTSSYASSSTQQPPTAHSVNVYAHPPQPPAAHSTNAYVPPYAVAVSQPPQLSSSVVSYSATHSQPPPPPAPSQLPYSLHVPSMAAPPTSHLPNSHHTPPVGPLMHGIPNAHPAPLSQTPSHHSSSSGQPPPTQPSQQSVHGSSHPPPITTYNHLPQISVAPYSSLSAYSRGATTSAPCVTNDNATIVVAAPSSYAVPPHTSVGGYPSLYAPYSNTPYLPSLPSHSRANRSPLPVISAKSTVSNHSASVTSSSLSISSAIPASIATTTVTTSHRDYATASLVNRSHSPRGHSPNRERDSYSSNVSSLSRSSVHTPVSNSSPFSVPSVSVPAPPAHAAISASLPVPSSVPVSVSSSLNLGSKPSIWGCIGSSSAVPGSVTTTAATRPSVPAVAPPLSVSSLHSGSTHSVANPFSAESLFQTSKLAVMGTDEADLLRRELDSRFLASQDRSLVTAVAAATAPPPPYLRTEMHHHQHQHTHVHQHTASLLPPPPTAALYPPPSLFKDIPKLGGVDSPFYRQIGIPNYPGYPSTLLHPSLGAATPFAPPTHIPTFTPKQVVDPTKPKPVKTGKWNAMHVRIAWEIYHHQQQKQQATDIKPSKSEMLNRTPSHLFPAASTRTAHELSPFSTPHRPPGTAFEAAHVHSAAGNPYSALGTSNVFSRYPSSPFPTLTQYSPAGLHESWARLQSRPVPGIPNAPYPTTLPSPWNIKSEPSEVDRERDREREQREQREREQREREQRDREQRDREQRDREQRDREKERDRLKEQRDRLRREEKQRKLLAQHHQQAQQQQQAAAMAAQAQQAQQKSLIRDRSPLRDTPSAMSQKEEELMIRGPPTFLRQPPRTLPPPPPQFAHWDHYRYDPFAAAYPPLMAFREEEQRAKFYGAYSNALQPMAHLRKETSPNALHVRPDLQLKKEDSTQSR